MIIPSANTDFELAPTFIAATTGSNVWIDGTAAGSTTNSTYRWGNNGGTTAPAFFDSINPHTGTNSMKVSNLAGGIAHEVHNYRPGSAGTTAILTMLPVLPSTIYKVTYWMKTNLVSGSSSHGAAMNILPSTSAGAVISNNAGTLILTTTSWTQYSITISTGLTAAYLDFACLVYGQSAPGTLIMDAWFDDIVITGPSGNFFQLLT